MEIADILFRKTKDPRIQSVTTVTDVEMSKDLRFAKVYFTTMAEEEQVMEGLSNATGYIRGELSRRLALRYSPEIIFKKDESVERGDRILSLLDEVSPSIGEENESDQTLERSPRGTH